MSFDLYLDDATVQEITDAADRNLATPTPEENSTFKVGKKPHLGTWSEVCTIRDSAVTAPKSDPTSKTKAVVKLTLEVLGSKEGGFDKNAGKTHYVNLYLDKAAIFDKSSSDHAKMARRAAVAMSAIKAQGVDVSGGINFDEWFNGEKPLVGQKVIAIVRKYEYVKDGTDTPGMDVDGFLATNL